ncbi:GAF domain-containing protein [bacterium]|nr:GAF domain-containing protein [bacterium]
MASISTFLDQPCTGAPRRDPLAAMLTISEALVSNLELNAVMDTILARTLVEVEAQQGSILLLDGDCLRMLAARGLPSEMVAKGYIPRKGSIAEWVIEKNQPLILNDHPSSSQYQALDAKRTIVSGMCVPLRMQNRILGTINLNRTAADAGVFQQQDLDLMVVLANQAAIFIENSRLHESVLKSERLAAVGQTVAGISHCIKNILTGVRGGLSICDMATQSQDWKLLGQGRDILQRNIGRLSSIVLDMLDYSKERQPVRAEVRVADLVEEVFGTTRSEAENRQQKLENRLDGSVATINVDGQQIYRCLLNLVQNAMDATPAGGTIWISAAREERARSGLSAPLTVLRVGDGGPGIPEENRVSIFEPFFSTKGSKGTGLGLAVTRKIIQEHGGAIEIESDAGQPAIFAIVLPA